YADLERRFARMRDAMPRGTVTGDVDEWREGRLVGTVDEIRAQREAWEALGVETLIVGAGPLPFSVTAIDDVGLLAAALLPLDCRLRMAGQHAADNLVQEPPFGKGTTHEPGRTRAAHHPCGCPGAVRQHAAPEAGPLDGSGLEGVQEGHQRGRQGRRRRQAR